MQPRRRYGAKERILTSVLDAVWKPCERFSLPSDERAAHTGAGLGRQVVYDADLPAATIAARQGGQLVLTDPGSAQWQQLVGCATTFSCSVGPALPRVLGPLLLTLPEKPVGYRPVLYACENDHGTPNLSAHHRPEWTSGLTRCVCTKDLKEISTIV